MPISRSNNPLGAARASIKTRLSSGLRACRHVHPVIHVDQELAVVCLSTIPDRFEGPPSVVHGGIVATLLDETMSKSLRARGLTAMTRQMEVDYLRPVHSAAPLRLEGRLVRSEGRKHWAEARIFNERGRVLAEAKGLFIEVHTGHGF